MYINTTARLGEEQSDNYRTYTGDTGGTNKEGNNIENKTGTMVHGSPLHHRLMSKHSISHKSLYGN